MIFLRNPKGFFLVISSLMARLWLGFEVSRLSIFRTKPRVVHERKMKYGNIPPSRWVLSRNMFYCLSVDENNRQVVIAATTPIELN